MKNDGHDGVRGFGGAVEIHPPYQREFVYKEKQRNAVIESIAEARENQASGRWPLGIDRFGPARLKSAR